MFIDPFNFSFFSITGQGIDLDYCDIEWFALEKNKDHFVVFEIASKYRISYSFVDFDISSKEFFPKGSDQISRSVMSDSLRPHESQHTRPIVRS